MKRSSARCHTTSEWCERRGMALRNSNVHASVRRGSSHPPYLTYPTYPTYLTHLTYPPYPPYPTYLTHLTYPPYLPCVARCPSSVPSASRTTRA